MPVRKLRLAVPADDFDAALAFYRDVLGMPEAEAVSSPGGRIAILAEPVVTTWNSLNSRLEGEARLQLTLFQERGAS